MRFVALDLETTGLDPTQDTIIEVAAIIFSIEKEENRYIPTDIVEQTMLINPGRPLSEEVSMITGITDEMLVGQQLWTDVRDMVTQWIGDAVIVGHNVLFDIAMLRSHGINLDHHQVLDTFELSEIFSQDSESLNLGYLAGRYGLSAGDKEHRALGDTRLSIGLLMHYVNGGRALSEKKKSILTLTGSKEESRNIQIFTEVAGIDYMPPLPSWDIEGSSVSLTLDASILTRGTSREGMTLTSLVPGRNKERDFLHRTVDNIGRASIGVFGQQQVEYISSILDELGISSGQIRTHGEFCSFEEIHVRIAKKQWKRKESILITKLLFWLEDTETGLLSELKLYGEERSEINFFRMRSGDSSPFYEEHIRLRESQTLLIEDLNRTLHEGSRGHTGGPLILKDIPLLEDALRRAMSIRIDIERLIHALDQLRETRRLIAAIRWIEGIYLSLPIRPTGPSSIPPGPYGETYFLTQEDVWNRGKEHLAITNRVLIESYHEWCRVRTFQDRHEEIHTEMIDRMIGAMITFHTVTESTGVVIDIQDDHVTLNYIPRDILSAVRSFEQSYTHIIGYGVGLHGEKVRAFLQTELGIETLVRAPETTPPPSLILDEKSIDRLRQQGNLGGTVILTTSAKHVREIGQGLKSSGLTILMQGISGGRGKQLGLFLKNPTNTVIIGTIDMWREELSLWSQARHVVIAKLPFDPPTDPYFLARTVGMKNNFTLYSEPMTIIKMNTLISRILSTAFSGSISCEDARLKETVWGQNLAKEIV